MSLAPFYRHGLSILGGALLALSLSALSAHAADCRTLSTVTHSADLANNATDGGHVAGHVHGQAKPAGWTTFLDKTQFNNKSDYDAAWSDFVKLVLPKTLNCTDTGAETAGKTVDVSSLPSLGGTSYSGMKCTNATCTTTATVSLGHIQFDFHRKSGGWVLNTAYPKP